MLATRAHVSPPGKKSFLLSAQPSIGGVAGGAGGSDGSSGEYGGGSPDAASS